MLRKKNFHSYHIALKVFAEFLFEELRKVISIHVKFCSDVLHGDFCMQIAVDKPQYGELQIFVEVLIKTNFIPVDY